MRILVTGATGRMGKHLVAALLEGNDRIRILMRDPEKAKMLWGDSAEYAVGDVTNKASLVDAVRDIDVIYHLAGLVSYDAPREQLFQVNVEGTRNILEVAKGKRIIHMSTTAVYGKKAVSPITEQTPFAPTDVYGESKAEADRLARAAGAIVLRPTVVYGPGFSDGFFKLFEMVEKKRMVVAGDGKNRLQWTHIDDLVAALLLAREKGRAGEAYDIVSDDVKTQEEMLGIVSQLLGAPMPKTHIPMGLLRTVGSLFIKPAYLETFASDRVFDCSKAKKELSWQPKAKLMDGLKDAAAEYELSKSG